MASNAEIYRMAMDRGDALAWNRDWEESIKAYAVALREFPSDPRAHNSLGFSLMQAKRYQDALKVYTRAHQLAPEDPLPLEKGADVLERLGRLKEAAQQYITVADLYMAQQDVDKAIGNWERATLLTPGLTQIHYRLARAYERIGRRRAAVLQYLTMAFNFQRNEEKDKALQAIERALQIEPNNPQVLNSKQAIQAGKLIAAPKLEDEHGRSAGDDDADLIDQTEEKLQAEGPLGEANNIAMAGLAEYVLSGDLNLATAQAIEGIELQKIEDFDQAITAFVNADRAGLKYPPIHMCLGYAYVKTKQWPNAEKSLQKVESVKALAAGAAHGLGLVYTQMGKSRQAAEYLLKALQMADTSLALNQDEAIQLSHVYNSLAQSTHNIQDADLARLNEQFAKWLTGSDWKTRIQETRRALADRLSSGDSKELAYMAMDTEVVATIGRIDRYIKQNMYTLAMDEAHFAIEKSPFSLPLHQRVAQILMEEGHIQEGIYKYNMVANGFLARDDVASAGAILSEVVQIAPMDTGVRTSLIELLERQEKWDLMLDEYMGLANAHYQLANMDQARLTYQEANRLAQRLNAPVDKRVEILHHMADMDMDRLEVRQAQRTYEQIRSLNPNDDRSRRALVDIYYRLNNPVEAVKELDQLLRLYAQQRRPDMILTTLEQSVALRPSDMALRSRLAAVYRQMKRNSDAIAQLDALGELQLDAGMTQEACATVRQIIALNPADTSQYQTLLSQLGC